MRPYLAGATSCYPRGWAAARLAIILRYPVHEAIGPVNIPVVVIVVGLMVASGRAGGNALRRLTRELSARTADGGAIAAEGAAAAATEDGAGTVVKNLTTGAWATSRSRDRSAFEACVQPRRRWCASNSRPRAPAGLAQNNTDMKVPTSVNPVRW